MVQHCSGEEEQELTAVMSMGGRPQRYEEFHSGTVRYGIFAKSRYTGIFRYGISLIFSSQDCVGIVRNFVFFSLLVP